MDSFDFRKSAVVIVPVVLPPSIDPSLSGRVRNIKVRAADNSGWLEPSSTAELGWDLKQDLKRREYLLLSEAYRLEDNEEGWQMYTRYISDWQSGRTTRSFPVDLLPAEVRRRQRGEHAGSVDPWHLPSPRPTIGEATDPDKVSAKGATKARKSDARRLSEDYSSEE